MEQYISRDPGKTWIWCSECVHERGRKCENCYLNYDGPVPRQKGKEHERDRLLERR